jgi:hypothetical protein
VVDGPPWVSEKVPPGDDDEKVSGVPDDPQVWLPYWSNCSR